MTNNARILVVDDHPIVRQGYQQLLDAEDDLSVCGVAESSVDALEQVRAHSPQLAIIDLTLTDGSALELIKQLNNEFPALKMLVVSAHSENIFAQRVLDAGAQGYINKQEATDRLVEGIRTVLTGQVYLSDAMSARLEKSGAPGQQESGDSVLDRLTDRELEVFQMIGRGSATKQIASILGLSPKTIERYKENIKRKLNIPHATELVQRATQWVLENN